MKIVFRVDASLYIGSGHVVRCLTLASRLRSSGADIHFICRPLPGHMIDFIVEQGFPVTALSSPLAGPADVVKDDCLSWLQLPVQQDADEVGAVLAGLSTSAWLEVDHYALDADWQKQMRSLLRHIAVIDALATRSPHDHQRHAHHLYS